MVSRVIKCLSAQRSDGQSPTSVHNPITNTPPESVRSSLDNLAVHFARSMNSALPSPIGADVAGAVRDFVATEPQWDAYVPVAVPERSPVVLDEVRRAVMPRKLSSDSTRPDGVPACLISLAPPEVQQALCVWVSYVCEHAVVPSRWKFANIMPIA